MAAHDDRRPAGRARLEWRGDTHGFSDTDPETARVHLDLLRAASPARRLRLAFSLSLDVDDLLQRAIDEAGRDRTST